MLQALTSAFKTTLTATDEDQETFQLYHPRRRMRETPLTYYTRLVNLQTRIKEKIFIPIKPLSFTLGLYVKNHKDRHGKVVFQEEYNKLKGYTIWPQRWLPAINNLPQLVNIINSDYSKLQINEKQQHHGNPYVNTNNNHLTDSSLQGSGNWPLSEHAVMNE